jgi:hypothetical protein
MKRSFLFLVSLTSLSCSIDVCVDDDHDVTSFLDVAVGACALRLPTKSSPNSLQGNTCSLALLAVGPWKKSTRALT